MTTPNPRPYRKTKRARSEEQTRLRITEAAVELHGTVGPAQTTVTDVAKRAGVSRMTVYNHFPTDVDLFTACSTHWARQNPFPDPSTWIDPDPAKRLRAALEELYVWYGLKQQMLGNIFRDTPNLPALAAVMAELWEPYAEAMVQALAEGWSGAGDDVSITSASLRLAIDFHTWELLTVSGLDHRGAARLMARMVSCSTR
jgi:AcrR family transcriptional regulator